MYRRACELMPGGVSSPVRAMRSIGRDPIFIASGSGAELTDCDGNTYIDWVCSWGPLIGGHAHPKIGAALIAAAERGTSFGAPTVAEVELAAAICDRVDSVEMVRLVNSGTEAAMSAIRLARAATGRDRIIKFAGAYHGHADDLLVAAGSGLATQGIPASPGVGAAHAATTTVVAWNDLAALSAAFDADRSSPVAALIAEPIPANMGLVPAAPGFLEALRELCDRHRAILIFDEVISGFRVARGGAQELLGVRADLTVLGKVIGGGLPAAAYGGVRELMEQVAPLGSVYQAGTLSGNPLATAAGLATLELLDDRAYRQIAETTELLAAALREAAAAAGGRDRVSVVSLPGLVTPFFAAAPPHDFEAAKRADHAAYGAFCRALLERGVYPPASGYEAWFVSLAHNPDLIERTAAACREAFAIGFAESPARAAT